MSDRSAESLNPIVEMIDDIFKRAIENARDQATQDLARLYMSLDTKTVDAAMAEALFRERLRRS
jgi:phage gp29-like protein